MTNVSVCSVTTLIKPYICKGSDGKNEHAWASELRKW